MLTKPVNGRCKFSLFDFEKQISCVNDIPVDWLKTCKDGLGGSFPVSFVILDNGYEHAILSFDGSRVSIVDNIDGSRIFFQYDFSLTDFTEELIKDIENNLDDWINWYPAKILGDPDINRRKELGTLLTDTKDELMAHIINKS